MTKTKYLGYKAEPATDHLDNDLYVHVLTTDGNLPLRMPPDTPREKIIERIKHFLPELDYSNFKEPEMQLQLGKKYKTKKGDIVGPLMKSDDEVYPFECPNTGVTWMGNGSYNVKPDRLDILEEYTEPETPLPPRENEAKSDKVGTGLTLIPWYSILELGKIFIEGLRYGRDNWKKGVNDKAYQEERLEHAMLHLLKWKEGDRSEEHLAKVAWFCVTQLELERLETLEKTPDLCSPDPILDTSTIQQAEAWCAVWDKCKELGMPIVDIHATGEEKVLKFIEKLAK